MKVSSKRFVLSSELKNDKGFRVRTSGIDMTEFNMNPIMLFMHQRPKGLNKNEVLPIGNIVDIKLEGNKLTGAPAFDDTDEFAMKLYQKVENGTIRMVSPGLVPLTWKKDDQGEVWLETSKLKEISLVDIGSNAEALAVTLYDEADEIVTLSLEQIITNLKPEHNMKLIQLSAPAILPLLQLSADATPEEAQEAIGNLVTLAAKQKTTIETLTTERDDFKTKYEDGVKLATEAKVNALVDQAITDRKIVEGQKEAYVKLAHADFENTKAVLDSMEANPTVQSQIKDGKDLDESFTKLTWDELDAQNKLVTLKAEAPELFKEKYKAKFGKDYKEN